jgi:hypothetical protein
MSHPILWEQDVQTQITNVQQLFRMNKRRQVNLYKLKKWVEDKKKGVPLKKK